MLFSRLLGSIQIVSATGALRLDTFLCHNLPQPKDTTLYYPYNADNGDALWAILSDASGAQLARIDFTANQQAGDVWLMSPQRVTVPATGELINTSQVFLGPGAYAFDFHLQGGRFYTFPFKVTTVPGENAGVTNHYLEGDWADWAYLYYRDADPGQALVWKVFLRHKSARLRADAKVRVEITRDTDGKLVATSREGMTRSLQAGWVRHDMELIQPMQGTSGGAYLKASEIVGRDGWYTLRMTIDGQHYGTWKFGVQGGKLNYAGRAARDADPLRSVFGGADAWWYERSAGAAPTTPTAPTAKTPPDEVQIPFNTGMIPNSTPINVAGKSLVPLRSIFQWLGAEVKFDGATQTITATKGNRVVMLRVGSTSATVDGMPVQLEVPATSQRGTTYVPLRFVAEAFDVIVKWDGANRRIYLIDGDRGGMIRVP